MENKPTNPSILEEASAIIYGDREQTYGKPDKNLDVIAKYWHNHLYARYGVVVKIDIEDVAIMMTLLKLARLSNTPNHRDSMVDACGYLALIERCNK